MSVEFSNAYQEILLENLMMVIKQNFVFQTQLKLTENNVNKNSQLQKQLDELTELYAAAKKDSAQLETYKAKAETNLQSHEEKTRIQSALNDEMKVRKSLEIQLSEKQKIIDELNNKISLLESVVPESKLKKLFKPSLDTFVVESKPVDGSNF